jgi:regulator of nucleoside diphosphate kinase
MARALRVVSTTANKDSSMSHKTCLITESDRCRLGSLLASREGRAWGKPSCLRTLDARLEEAEAVNREETPSSLVTMNSTVRLLDVHSGDRRPVTLVYPGDRDLKSDGISVFDPLGTQLLGSHVGDMLSSGKRKFRVTQILYQPETAGASHL